MKRETYFDISECTEDELDELRMRLYCADVDDDFLSVLTEEEKQILENCDIPERIPYSILESVYCGICFVDEDFFCNCE